MSTNPAASIVELFFSEFTINHATMGTVVRIQKEPDELMRTPGLLTVTINEADVEDIRWFWPCKPAIGSRCLVVFGDNSTHRAVAVACNEISEIKTKIAGLWEIEINSKLVKILQRELLKIILNSTELKILIEAGASQLTLDGITGDVVVGNGDLNAVDSSKLKTWMEEINECLDNLYSAIQNSPVIAMDGGASYKAGLVQAISTKPLPKIPTSINSTNLKFDSSML